MKQLLTTLFCFLLFAPAGFAQVSLTTPGTPVTLDFAGFAGTGFDPNPVAGQLDSDDWSITGFSDGTLPFGGANASGDFAKGVTTGGVTSGGCYAFDDGTNQMMWIQPTSSDFTPGTLTLRIQNNSSAIMNFLDVAYTLNVLNDADRGNTFNFSWSQDSVTFTPVAALDYLSPDMTDGITYIVNQSTVIAGLSVPIGGYVYIRWTSDDASGGGSRDEFGLDDIVLNIPTVAPPAELNFTTAASSISEGGGSATLTVSISSPDTCSVEVALDAGSSTATAGSDFSFSSPLSLVLVGANETFSIPITDDMMVEGDETVVLMLQNASGCAIGPVSQTTLTILDNEYPAYPIGTINTVDVNGVSDSSGVVCQIQGIVYGGNLRPGGLQFTVIDATGGIGLFEASGDYGYTVTEGDEVVVQGTIGQFNGLLQINPDTVWMVSAGNPLKMPTIVTQMGESNESDLTKVNGVHLVDPAEWTGTGSGFNVRVTTGSPDTILVRIDNDVDLYGLPAPVGTFNVTGLGGQFDSSNPYTDGYQLLPRYQADIEGMMPGVPLYPIGTVNTVDVNGVADSLGLLCRIQGVVYGVNQRPVGLQFTIIDATGGIGVFNSVGNLGYTVTEGDEIMMQGTIGQFSGLTQMDPDSIWFLSSGNPLKSPTIVTQLGESNESDLTKVLGVHMVDPSEWTGTGSGFNVRVTDGSADTILVRIDNDVNLYSFPAPTGTFNVTGLGGQFDSSNPYTDGYQLLPRYNADIDSVTGANPQVSFAMGAYSVNENGGSVNVDVSIVNPNSNPTSVDISVAVASTATPGSDYTFFGGGTTLTFPANFAGNQSVAVTIVDDMIAEPSETVILGLSSPTNGATLGLATTTVTILDDDAPLPAYPIGTVTTNDVNGVADSLNVECQIQGIVHGLNQRPGGLTFTLIDATGGIAIFSSSQTFGYTVVEGDELIVQGPIVQFSGLTEMVPDTLWMVSSGNTLQTPTPTSTLDESTESEMVIFEGWKIIDPSPWDGLGSGDNVDITNYVDTVVMRIDNDVDLFGTTPPAGWFNATGIGGQFDSSSPYTSGYQFLPRYLADIVLLPLPQMAITGNDMTVVEGTAGTVTIPVQITNSNPDSSTVEILIDPASTATAGTDFNLLTTSLTFPGAFSGSILISVEVLNDVNMELSETVVLGLFNPTNGTISSNKVTLTITDDDAGAIGPELPASFIRMYPNPASERVILDTDRNLGTVILTDLAGRELFRRQENRSRLEIDLSGIGGGLYLIRVITDEGIWSGKLLRE